jgi:hypothetical protein
MTSSYTNKLNNLNEEEIAMLKPPVEHLSSIYSSAAGPKKLAQISTPIGTSSLLTNINSGNGVSNNPSFKAAINHKYTTDEDYVKYAKRQISNEQHASKYGK